jgi:protein-disulfide isomerase
MNERPRRESFSRTDGEDSRKEWHPMIRRAALMMSLAILSVAGPALGQSAPAASVPTSEQAQIIKNTEAFVRDLFAWGPEFKVSIGPLASSPSPDFYLAPIHVTINGQTDTGTVYVSKDGKTFLRGEMFDMTANPFADNFPKLHIEGNPSQGPSDAKVTIVEFSDFECPHCREFSQILRSVEPEYPQVRVVFKDFPLTQIHPWADTAAIAARCAFIQKPSVFWTYQAQIFDNQDLISPENVWDKLSDFATQDDLDADTLKTCMASPEAKQAVEANRRDGEALNVSSTPTIFINGRPLIGGDKPTLEQYIKYELAKTKP